MFAIKPVLSSFHYRQLHRLYNSRTKLHLSLCLRAYTMSREPIVIADDSEDEDVKQAIALSLQGQEEINQRQPKMSFLGLNRADMEAERLSRKRARDISPPPVVNKRAHISSETTAVSHKSPTSTLKFPTGTILRTWTFGFERHRDIKLEEVLDKSNLRNAVLSSYQLDEEWVLSKIDTSRTRITFVMHAKTQEERDKIRTKIAGIPYLNVCFPYMGAPVFCMHSKLMLLSYDSHLRVVVPSANLLPFDWGETGIMENSVFLIDLPRKVADGSEPSNDTGFKEELVFFCKAMGLAQNLINSLDNFDFAATSNIAFVHTIGGTHPEHEDLWRRTGHCGLARAIRDLNLVSEQTKAAQVDFVASSIGSLTPEFLATIYLAMLGDDGTTELSWRSKKAPSKSFRGLSKADVLRDVLAHFRVYFPSLTTVQQSVGGEPSGGTNWLASKAWEGPKFPRANFKDNKSRRNGLLMHNKMIFARPTSATSSPGWVYHGSANCSESAWGKLTHESKGGSFHITCRNWECGIVMSLDKTTSASSTSSLERLFDPLLYVPMKENTTPLEEMQPWFVKDWLGV